MNILKYHIEKTNALNNYREQMYMYSGIWEFRDTQGTVKNCPEF